LKSEVVPGSEEKLRVPRTHLAEVDLLRVVGVLLVLLVHTDYWPSQGNGLDQLVYGNMDLAARISLPIFVMVSGLVLARTYSGRTRTGEFFGRRLARTAVPWLFWALFLYVATQWNGEFSLPPNSHAVEWWLGGPQYLYFLVLLVQLNLLFAFWPLTRRGSGWLVVICVPLQIALQLLRVLLVLHPGLLRSMLLVHAFEESPFWLGYFALGVYAGLRLDLLDRLRRYRWLTLALAVVGGVLTATGLLGRIAANWAGGWVAGTGAFLRPELLISSTATALILWWSAPWVLNHIGSAGRRAVQSVSRLAMGIYLIQQLIIWQVGPYLHHVPRPFNLREPLPYSLTPFLILFGVAFLGSWCLSGLMARWRVTGWVLGMGRMQTSAPTLQA